MFCNFGGLGFGFSPWMIAMMGFKIAILAVLIVLIMRFIKNHTTSSNDALKILNEKFASGDISEEEYMKRKNIITQKHR